MFRLDRLARYALWGAVAGTSYAKQRHKGLVTAWIYHAVADTLVLFLPEIYRGLSSILHLDKRARRRPGSALAAARGVADEIIAGPQYLAYTAPLPLAFIVSHPRIALYENEWANRQLFGFGLDSIPHAVTAYASVRLVVDTLGALRRQPLADRRLARGAAWAARHAGAIAAALLALATAGYEYGEYLIHEAELDKVGGDPEKVDMFWSVEDTVQDVISNAAGALAALTRR